MKQLYSKNTCLSPRRKHTWVARKLLNTCAIGRAKSLANFVRIYEILISTHGNYSKKLEKKKKNEERKEKTNCKF